MNELGARGNLCTRLADYFGRFWGKVLGAWAAGPSGAALLATWHLPLTACAFKARRLAFEARDGALTQSGWGIFLSGVVRKGGLEPPRLAALVPKTRASTNSATFAISKL